MSERLGVGSALSALHQGIKMCLGDRDMRGRIVVAVCVNALAFMGVLAGLLWGADGLLDWALGGPVAPDPTWYESAWYAVKDGLRWALYVVVVLGVLIYSPVLFTILASAVLPVFHSPVFAAARANAGGPTVEGAPTGMATVIVIEVGRLLRFVCWSLALLPLNLLPGIGSVAYLAAQFYLSAKTLGWDLLSHHFELHAMDMEAQRVFFRQHRGLVLALGGGATLLAMVPLLQLFFITTNVAGAGVLSAWLDGAQRGT